jgi:ribosome-associated translation inhibitor RaiA
MIFQVRTDNHIENSEALADRLRGEVEGALTKRFSTQLRRVEVYLQDANSHKGGIDKACSLEAHLSGHQPVTVHGQGASIDEAFSSAVDKLLRALEHTIGRLEDRGGRVSMSGEEA